MTFLYLALTFMALMAAGLLLLPLWRARRLAPRAPIELAIYKDQLAEIARDRERGLLGATEAQAARVEVERRLLRAGRRAAARPEEGAPDATGLGRLAGVMGVILVPLLAALLYADLGQPGLPDEPLASRAHREDPQMAQIDAMVSGLEQRLKANPDDLPGWLRLGRSKLVLRDPQAAVDAFRRAQALAPDQPEVLGGLGEALTQVAGSVTPEAEGYFARLHELQPEDPRGLYYLGLAQSQSGDNRAAIERWRSLLAVTPADAPWRQRVEDAIREAATQAGLDPAQALANLPSPPSQPSAGNGVVDEEAKRIASLPPAEQAAAIKGMVDQLQARLDKTGGDAVGWHRLAQARLMLGDEAAARAAYAKAAAMAPNDPAILSGYAQSLLGPMDARTKLPTVGDEAARLFAKAAEFAPNEPMPLWFLGIHALQQGHPDEARKHWQKVLSLLDPKEADYAAVKQQLDALGG
jgi:cytochrome c-type biogenesis protein CcmH